MKIRSFVSLCLFLAILPCTKLYAQKDSVRIREFGLGFSNLTSFNILYQFGTAHTLYRFSLESIGFSAPNNSSNDIYDTNSNHITSSKGTNASFSFNFAIIKAKRVAEKLEFLYGGIIGIGYTYANTTSYSSSYYPPGINDSYSTESTSYTVNPFIGVILGARFAISNSLFLYAEISPRVHYAYTSSTTIDTYPAGPESSYATSQMTPGINNFSNSGATLSIVYRFKK
ncbi:MAG TPA: hypothetical protein VNZ45_13375 [Bacteroidia bacterium]|jgi:hypothetical protein|nr:hypothetical protein [Bacteroidia bacterium]